MGLLILTHIDGNDVLFTAVEEFGEGQCGFGLPDAARAHEHEDRGRFRGVIDPGMGGPDHLGYGRKGMILADDPLTEQRLHIEDRLDLVCQHSAGGNAGPARDHLGDGLTVHRDLDEGIVALGVRQLGLELFVVFFFIRQGAVIGVLFVDLLHQLPGLCDSSGDFHFFLPLGMQCFLPLLHRLLFRGQDL